MRIIGLTGSMASGKSTVSAYLRTKDIPVIDCDAISRHALDRSEKAYSEVVEEFGNKIVLPDGNIDRKALAGIVFADEEKLNKLNSIIHPVVRQRAVETLLLYQKFHVKTAVVDAPLLIESGMTAVVNEVWVVYASPEVQLRRAMARDNASNEQIEERMKSQMPLEEKKKHADVLINNDGTLEELYRQIDKYLERE